MNLIVTCPRHHEGAARGELAGLLGRLGDDGPRIGIAGMPGVLVADTSLDPVGAVRGVRGLIDDEPWAVRFCLRFIPVQKECPATEEGIADAAAALAAGMAPSETYRITIEKRDSGLESGALIRRMAAGIANKVRLESPDRVVLVETVGEAAGVSLLHELDILSVDRAKRGVG